MKKEILTLFVMVLVSTSVFGQHYTSRIHTSSGTYTISTSVYGHFSSTYISGPSSAVSKSKGFADRKIKDLSELFGISEDSINHMICGLDPKLVDELYFSLLYGTSIYYTNLDWAEWYASKDDFDILYWAVDYAQKLQNREWVDQFMAKHNFKPFSVDDSFYNPSELRKLNEDKNELGKYIKKLIVLKYPNLVNRRQYRKYTKYQKIA
jgi:hypothetical protein